MKKSWVGVILFSLALSPTLRAQTAPSAPANPEPNPVVKRVEEYYRRMYALGRQVQLNVSAPQPSSIPGLLQVTVELSEGPNRSRETSFVSADGRFLIRGEFRDMAADPFADTRAAIKLADQPSRGPADSSVTIVLYSDFQCPYCREMYNTLETQVLKKHPEIRLVYKDFPIVQIHPWAMTASIGAQCAYVQSNGAFWKVYSSLYQSQREITPQNIQERLEGFATAAGLDLERFKACIAGNEVRARLQESLNETQALGLNSTPTIFINGRRLVGNVPQQVLDRVIDFELQPQPQPQQTQATPKSDK